MLFCWNCVSQISITEVVSAKLALTTPDHNYENKNHVKNKPKTKQNCPLSYSFLFQSWPTSSACLSYTALEPVCIHTAEWKWNWWRQYFCFPPAQWSLCAHTSTHSMMRNSHSSQRKYMSFSTYSRRPARWDSSATLLPCVPPRSLFILTNGQATSQAWSTLNSVIPNTSCCCHSI